MKKIRSHYCKSVIASLMVVILTVSSLGTSYAQGLGLGFGAGGLPEPGTMVVLSQPLNPPVLTGIKVYANNPFRFDFILDKGDADQPDHQLNEEFNKLIKYFFASLTVPEKDLWVNLSPYEKDRIVPEVFGQTGMGRDLLAEDYMLKQITASVIYPEGALGQRFWKELYAKAQQKYGTTDIAVNTFNKVWIVPEKAVVYENIETAAAYVKEATFKVVLETDYLALNKNAQVQSTDKLSETQELGNQVVREIVIPALESEVNTGSNFAQLRQIYHSLILATWYKKKIKGSLLSQAYVDQKKVAGVNSDDPKEVERIWERYVESFKKGVFNYIQEKQDVLTEETIPRKYFSGGCNLFVNPVMDIRTADKAALSAAGKNLELLQVMADAAQMNTSMDADQGPRFTRIPAEGVILTFGTSSTKGIVEPSYSYPAILGEMTGYRVINGGAPAERLRNVGDRDETKDDGIARFSRVFNEHQPSLLILWHGRNDLIDKRVGITRWDRQDAVAQDLKTLIKYARDRNCQVLLLGSAGHEGKSEDLQVYRKVAQDTNTPYLRNIEDGILNNPDLMFDKMHADSQGNLVIARRIAEFLWKQGALESSPEVSVEVPKSHKLVIQEVYPPLSEGNAEQHVGPDGMVYFNVGIGKEGVTPGDIQVQIKLRFWDTGWRKQPVSADLINDWGQGWYRFKAQIPRGVDMYTIKVSYDGKPGDDLSKFWIWREPISVQHERGQQIFQRLQPGKLILAFGSSSTSGVIQQPGFSYPEQLNQIMGFKYRVVNHGFAGERIKGQSHYAPGSPGGVARWKEILNRYPEGELNGSLAIIWHGRNDLFDGMSLIDVGTALKEMVLDAQKKGMRVLLMGVARNDGTPDEGIYRKAAIDTGVAFLPGVMEEIWGIPQYMMADRIHTNVLGNRRIAESVAHFLKDHGAVDPAMIFNKRHLIRSTVNEEDKSIRGGIDLTPQHMDLKDSGSGIDGIRFHFDSAQLLRMQNSPGLTPVIINILPMKDLNLFLGLSDVNAVLGAI